MNVKNTLKLSISLDHKDAIIQAGELVTGRVMVETNRRVTANELLIEIFGSETLTMQQARRKARQEILLQEAEMLRDFAQCPLEAGATAFVFSFQLRSDLPPSMQFRGGQDGDCSIQYSITARCSGAIEVCHPRLVRPSKVTLIRPLIFKPKTYTLRSASSRDRGLLLCGAKVDNAVLAKGDTVSVSIGCFTNSRVDIGRVNLRLIEEITWGKGKKRTIILRTERGVGLSITRRNNRVHKDMQSALDDPRNTVSLRVPRSARTSAAGASVVVSHYIEAVFIAREGGESCTRVLLPIQVVDTMVDKSIYFDVHEIKRQSIISSTVFDGSYDSDCETFVSVDDELEPSY